ncbi:bifunctional Mitochondrial substrate-solute carrier/Mitochondrial carrier domain superfamily [Babesia duncani]|uniref:Bifunctional Mitochondrial substrate-solute carrier/Mitochondrial carrier domain superfamily n=1 Tax=Babesia duncani TaxID=323732 RepID=A0AAD9PJY6_9APIC|nr:bifunctional Mitochondrial substrate-solute carrier/Mitochondrial carrier domain superfamily [Babesia duncani]
MIFGSFLTNVICGGVAGLVADALLYPLDTLKTRSQVKSEILNAGSLSSGSNKKGARFKSLYGGIGVLVLGDVPSCAAFYGIYEFTKDTLIHDNGKLPTPLVHFLGSSLGQVTSLIIRNPFEVIKQQTQARIYKSSFETFKGIKRTQGFRGLYAGFFPTLLREMPFDGIQFVLWEKLKTIKLSSGMLECLKFYSQLYDSILIVILDLSNYMASKTSTSVSSCDVVVSALCGSFAGGCAGVATAPLDVAKTRLMTQGHDKMYKSTWDCITRIAREEGAAALFRGLGIRIAWLTLGGFIFFAALETSRLTIKPSLLKRQNDKENRNM